MLRLLKTPLNAPPDVLDAPTESGCWYSEFGDEPLGAPRYVKCNCVIIENGHVERVALNMPELLHRVQQHHPRTAFDSNLPGSVKLRDLRQLCSYSVGFEGASIEVRRNCVLVNLVDVRAIILHEKVIVLQRLPNVCETLPSSLVSDTTMAFPNATRWWSSCDQNELVIQRLHNVCLDHNLVLFELAILEGLLHQMCSSLCKRVSHVVASAETLIGTPIDQLAGSHGLHQVYELQRHVGNLNDRLKSVSEAIQQVLNNDQDLRRLELSFFWKNMGKWEHPPESTASEDIEMLLESYHQQVVSMLRHGTRIDELLDDTLHLIHLHLASIRNTFLKCELAMEMVGTIISCIAAFTGLFGMNIPNGLETNNNVFWPIAGTALGACVLCGVITVYLFHRVKL